MIIYGWGFQTSKKIGPVFKDTCSHCNNEDYWLLTRTRTWFTLFFIPVIPYSTKYFFSCPICKYGLTLNNEQLEKIRPLAETNQQLLNGEIGPEEHSAKVGRLNREVPKDEMVEAKMITVDQGDLKYCGECGTSAVKELKFCGNCGVSMEVK